MWKVIYPQFKMDFYFKFKLVFYGCGAVI